MSETAVSEENNQQSSNLSGPSALEILKRQDRESAKKAIAASLYRHGVKQEEPVDLSYVVKEGESVDALTPESGDDALEVYRHSTAHLLAAAVLDRYPRTRLGVGPALLDDQKGGVYPDSRRGDAARREREAGPRLEKRRTD